MKKYKFNRAVKLYIEKDTTVKLLFDDGITKKLDLKTILHLLPSDYQRLLNENFFKRGKLDGCDGIVWSRKVDLSVDTIYERGEIVPTEKNSLNYIIGFRVKQARLSKELSQQELSELTGIDQSVISKLEKGSFNPSINFLTRIFDVLGKKLEIKVK